MGSAGNAPRGTSFSEPVTDPPLNVAVPETEVSADAKSGWTLTPVPPGVDGGDRYAEEVSEFLCRKEGFETLHAPIVRPDPFSSRSFDAQTVTLAGSDAVFCESAGIRC